MTSIWYLFENGVFYQKEESVSDSEAINGTITIDNSVLKPAQKQIQWGAFRISENDTIEFESWRPNFDKCFRVMRMWGHILSDTTFELYNVEIRDFKGNFSEAGMLGNATLHFRKHPIKPDSTNDFVK